MPAPIPTYATYEELDSKLQEYFAYCEEKGEFPNIAGMTVFCGFATRQSWKDYEKKSDDFLHVIKKAKSQCYNMKFQAAAKGKMDRSIFIFDAVNNHDMFNTRSENKNEQYGKGGGAIETKWTVEFVDKTSIDSGKE
jgi:hypothetical protein